MKASIVDLRRRMREVLQALDRNEPVTIMYRGKQKALLVPVAQGEPAATPLREYEAFGIWKDREDLQDVDEFVSTLRRGRYAL